MNPAAQAAKKSQTPIDGLADSPLLEQAKALWESVRGLAHSRLQLVALETKLAGQSLVAMIVAGVVAAVLLVSAWLGLVCIGVLLLVDNGVLASVAMMVAVALNLIIALLLYGWIRRKSRNLQFPATVRSLRPIPSVQKDPGNTA